MRGSRFRRLGFGVLAMLCVLPLSVRAAAWAEPPRQPDRRPPKVVHAPRSVPDEILVRFKDHASPSAIRSAHAWGRGRPVWTSRIVKNLGLVKLPPGLAAKDAIRRYRQHPDVLYAEPNYVVTIHRTPNDPRFTELWGLNNIGQTGGLPGVDSDAPEAWELTTGRSAVVVAVIDSGIDYTHPDLAANMYRNTRDCNADGIDDDGNGFVDDCHGIDTINDDSDPFDDAGHGTHVAGTIGAVGNNGIGVVGVNWNVRLMACKALDDAGDGTTLSVLRCLEYVALMRDRGVNIVATNNSYGGGSFSEAERDLIDSHRQRGILFVAAAGNDASDNDAIPAFPAGYTVPNVIAVAATTHTGALADFSNAGLFSVHLGAPGEDILSTTPGNSYDVKSGTSMAAPHVTGVAALLKAHDPTRSWKAIKNSILSGGHDSLALELTTLTGKALTAHGALACTDSTVARRLLPAADIITASVGIPIDLAVLHINCARPNGDVIVTADPGSETVRLRDNGSAPDRVADDGIYAGQWVPATVGTHTLTFTGGGTLTVVIPSIYVARPVPFSYRTIAGTSLDLSDESSALLELPFAITFGGLSHTSLFVADNGYLNFTSHFQAFINQSIPTDTVTTLVAPFWDDLNPSGAQNVFWGVIGAAPNRELVIEWRDVKAFDCEAGNGVTFQVVFFEGRSDFVFNYADTSFGCEEADRGRSATVGVQVAPGVGTQFSLDSPSLESGTALRWSPAPTVRLSLIGSPFAEAGGTATVTATLSEPVAHDVTVVLGFSGSATRNVDYLASADAITIPAGNLAGSVTLTAAADALDEPDETVIVDIMSVTGAVDLGSQQVVARITDDDPRPTVTLSLAGSPLAEAGGAATVTATLSGASGRDVTVTLGFGGSATAGVDYTASATTITIPAGSLTGSITLTAVPDAVDEPDETVFVHIESVTNAVELGAQRVGATIVDDDPTPTVRLSLNQTSLAEAGGAVTVTATLSGRASRGVTVTLGFGGTATFGADYTASASTIKIPAGSLTGSITLSAVQDAVDEPGETVVVEITGVANAWELDTQRVVATIIDDDPRPSVMLSLAGSPLAEAGGAATVTATLSGLSSRDVTVTLGFGGTATFGVDYTAPASTITIPAGGLTGSITLTAVQDGIDEPDETVFVHIESVTNAVELGAERVGATIVDDDPTPTVALSLNQTSLAEAGGAVTITATLSGRASRGVTITLGFGGTATFGVDYTASASTIKIPAGSLTGSITLTAVQDAVDEPGETVVVEITTVTNALELDTQRVVATITDDDPRPTVTLSLAGSPLAEAGGAAIVTATLSGRASRDVAVTLGFGGTAIFGVDYTASATTITIAAGSLTGSITLTAVQDAIHEPDNSVFVHIASVTNAVELGAQRVGGIITDDDP